MIIAVSLLTALRGGPALLVTVEYLEIHQFTAILYKTGTKQQYFDPGEYIIGDKAYPVTGWCMLGYIDRRNLTEEEQHFNSKHAKTRQVIERAFALLFGRFRRLRYLDMHRMDLLPSTVIAACVLHNICIINNDELLDAYEEEGRPFINRFQNDENAMADEVDGNILRRNIARELL